MGLGLGVGDGSMLGLGLVLGNDSLCWESFSSCVVTRVLGEEVCEKVPVIGSRKAGMGVKFRVAGELWVREVLWW